MAKENKKSMIGRARRWLNNKARDIGRPLLALAGVGALALSGCRGYHDLSATSSKPLKKSDFEYNQKGVRVGYGFRGDSWSAGVSGTVYELNSFKDGAVEIEEQNMSVDLEARAKFAGGRRLIFYGLGGVGAVRSDADFKGKNGTTTLEEDFYRISLGAGVEARVKDNVSAFLEARGSAYLDTENTEGESTIIAGIRFGGGKARSPSRTKKKTVRVTTPIGRSIRRSREYLPGIARESYTSPIRPYKAKPKSELTDKSEDLLLLPTEPKTLTPPSSLKTEYQRKAWLEAQEAVVKGQKLGSEKTLGKKLELGKPEALKPVPLPPAKTPELGKPEALKPIPLLPLKKKTEEKKLGETEALKPITIPLAKKPKVEKKEKDPFAAPPVKAPEVGETETEKGETTDVEYEIELAPIDEAAEEEK